MSGSASVLIADDELNIVCSLEYVTSPFSTPDVVERVRQLLARWRS